MKLFKWFNGEVATMSSADSGDFGDNNSLHWELSDDGTLTISGTGAMPNWESETAVSWNSQRGNIKKVSIMSGVTSIGRSAFQGCGALTSIILPGSITSIVQDAFTNCTQLASIELPNNPGFISIDKYAFVNCSKLSSITIPESITKIEQGTFKDCTNLSSVTLPGSLYTIGNRAFMNCGSLREITIPASVTSIDAAFESCNELTTITFAGTTPPTIDSSEFSYCDAITEINVPAGTEEDYKTIFGRLVISDLADKIKPYDPPTQPSGGSSGSSSSGSSSSRHHRSSGGSTTAANTAAKTTASDGSAVKSNSPFTDVSEADWYYPDVAFVHACGLLGGTGDGSFAPYASVNRLSLAELFYRMEGSPAVADRNNFTDVVYDPNAAESYNAVTWARQSGVLTGFGDGTFRPDSPITREQFAAAFYNYAKYKGYDVSDTGALDTYADGAAVSAWSRDAVNWAVGAGIINSRTDELFAPQAETMSAELAVMLHRFIEKYGLVPVPSPTGDGTILWIKLPDAAA